MSDPTSSPPGDTPAGTPPAAPWPVAAPPPGPVQPSRAARPSSGRRWLLPAATALAGVLVGVIATSVVLLVLVGLGEPVHRYDVSVILAQDVTADQKRQVETALRDLRPVDGITAQSREQTWEKFKEQFKDQPDLLNGTRPESMPESFRLTTTGTVFDCAALAPVRRLAGVDDVTVLQLPVDGRPGALLDCS